MKKMKKKLLVMLMVVGVIGMVYSLSWAQAAWRDPIQDEFDTADLFLARPACSRGCDYRHRPVRVVAAFYDPHGRGGRRPQICSLPSPSSSLLSALFRTTKLFRMIF